MIGKTLGHYEILAPLGAGGMGEVYRARDSKLDRDVAIKVLPDELAADPERLARFEREAKLLAALSHANIGAIHGIEEADGVRFLVLELIEGQSLEQRLGKGAIPVPQALDIARQIAEALEAAHDEDIVHRDVKPANVLLTTRGGVKVLDFGIAKSAAVEANPVLTEQATNLTIDGTLMGTPPYMAPEQIRGEEADKRADIWAFGCVLYETLTGSGAFVRETVADTLVAVLESEPDWDRLPKQTPGAVRTLLTRCLRKRPDRRLRDIGDARIEIEEAEDVAGSAATGRPRSADSGWPWLVGVAGALVGGVAVWLALGIYGGGLAGTASSMSITTYSELSLPEGQFFSRTRPNTDVAVSPDGGIVVHFSGEAGSPFHLRWRRLDDTSEAPDAPVPGGRGGHTPFFDPTGNWLGFIVGNGDIFKWEIGSPAAVPVGTIEGIRGATWGPNGTIVVGTWGRGLQAISSDRGSDLQTLSSLDDGRGEISHRFPSFLPGGRQVVFSIYEGGAVSDSAIAIYSFDTGKVDRIPGLEGTAPQYLASGHLVFSRFPDIYAVAFDPETATVRSAAEPVLSDVEGDARRGTPKFAASNSGIAVYGGLLPLAEYELVAVDLEGDVTPIDRAPPGNYYWLRVSPGGDRVVTVRDVEALGSVWVYELEIERPTSMEQEGDVRMAIWGPDDNEVTFGSIRSGTPGVAAQIYRQGTTDREASLIVEAASPAADGERTAYHLRPADWSPDGQWLILVGQAPDGRNELWQFPVADPSAARRISAAGAGIEWARFSPNGKWFAYQSNDSGTLEVWTAAFPDDGSARPVSAGGGGFPLVSPDGDRIYYRSGARIMSVAVDPETGERTDAPVQQFIWRDLLGGGHWDLQPGSDGFIGLRTVTDRPPRDRLGLITNWLEELKRQVPVER